MKVLAIVLAIVFFVLGGLYWTGSVQIGASHPGPHHSHGVLFFVLGVLSLIWMRFQGNSSASPAR